MENLVFENVDLIDTAYHVSNTRNLSLEREFVQSVPFKLEVRNNLLHLAAQTLNSYKTMQLLIKVLGRYDMDTRDERGETAAFLAASYGNIETLQWMIDNGADLYFEKNKLMYESLSQVNLIKECKYIHFCGYSLLDISAQNGHYDTVVMLLTKDKKMLNHTTSFGLSAFDLAAENGHENILRYMITINKTLANEHSLHRAAEVGHTHVVRFLLNHGIQDICLPCNTSLYWIPSDFQRAQQNKFQIKSIFHRSKQILYDDWRKIMCETALHAAVRNCHLNVIKILTSQNQSAVKCFDRSGRTPILSTVYYNCSSAFYYLYEHDAYESDRCRDVHYFSQSDLLLSENEKEIYLENNCPAGWTIVHLLVLNSEWNIIKFLLESNFNEWDIPDDEGVTPLHLAHCRYSVRFFSVATFGKTRHHFNVFSRSKNGSTVHHSAAICGNIYGHLYHYWPQRFNQSPKFITGFYNGVPDVLDNDGRSILHYFFLGNQEFDGLIYFMDIYFESNINMTRVDRFGKNFMHYAVKFCRIDVIRHILHRLRHHEIVSILLQKDLSGKIPLQLAFDELRFWSDKSSNDDRYIALPNCTMDNIFLVSCAANYSILLQPEEFFIWQLLSLYGEKNITLANLNVTDMVYVAANRSSFYLIQMIRAYFPKEFYNVVSDSRHLYNIFQIYRGLYLAYLVLPADSVLQCNAPHQSNAFASIIMNREDKFWPYFTDFGFLDLYLNTTNMKDLDNCFDKEGFNLLHRAAIGGNHVALKYLIDKGSNVSVPSFANDNLIEMIIRNADYSTTTLFPDSLTKKTKSMNVKTLYFQNYTLVRTRIGRYLQYTPVAVDYDISAHYVLTKLNLTSYTMTNYWRELFCQMGKKALSLVHLGAAKGMIQTLQIIHEIFGRSVMECRNRHNITPFFLARLNDHFNIIHWLRSINIAQSYPLKWVVPAISYLYNVNFEPNVNRPRICKWSLFQQVSFLTKMNYIYCFGINTELDTSTIYLPFSILYRTKDIHNTFGTWLKLIRSFSYHLLNLRKLVFKECNNKSINKAKCSQITAEASLKFRGATLASRMLYKNVKLFEHHVKQMTSYMLMYNGSLSKDVPSFTSLYQTIFSGKLKYLNSLKMTDTHHHFWAVSKLGDIETHGSMASFNADIHVSGDSNLFFDILFNYFERFHFDMWRQKYLS